MLRLLPPAVASLDAWIAEQPESRPSRPEAIRRILADALAQLKGARTSQCDVSLDRQIVDQETAIAEMPEHSGPSPESGMATMDKAVAENDLIDMKNKRTRRKNAKRG